MTDEQVVKIIAERIMNKGLNPKTEKTYILDDVTNKEYLQAVEKYIQEHTKTQ